MKNIGFVSLGCAKNLNDTEAMLGLLDEKGYQIVDEPLEAEILIVNTCTFIEPAKEESIQAILQMGAYKSEGKCQYLIATGCLVQRYGEELKSGIPELDGMLGTFSWNRIIELIDQLEKEKASEAILFRDTQPLVYDVSIPRIRTGAQHSAYIKIAEGCSNACSYCIIPYVRGPLHSRSIESVVDEAKKLVAEGVQEINLIAQDTTSYGMDWAKGVPQIIPLLQQLEELPGVRWIRLLYCYPNHFSADLIQILKKSKKILPYVDMPLQHIDREILKRMNRKESEEMVRQTLANLRREIPGIAIRTTMIVGFPGETDAQFQKLCEFVKEFEFDHVGVFPYSQEESTVAARMEDQISEEIKEERYHQLMAIQAQVSEKRNKQMIGKTFDVIVEGKSDEEENLWFGRSYREAADVDGRVFIESDRSLKIGEFVQVEIEEGFAYDLVGSLKRSMN